MNGQTDLRHGLRIGRAEFLRSLRSYFGSTRRILGFFVVLLVLGGNALLSLPAVFLLARQVESVAAIPLFGPLATALPVGLLLLAALRTVERISGVDGEENLLTTVHPRALIVGLLLAELARLTLWFGVPIVLTAAVFAAGVGAPTLVVTTLVVVAPLICCTAVWGYALGMAVLRLLRRLPTVRRLAKVGGVLLFVAVIVGSQMAGQFAATTDVSLTSILTVLTVGPLTEYVALAFVGTPLSPPTGVGGVAVLVGWVALTPVGLVVAERQATALWFSDGPVRRERSAAADESARQPKHFSPPRPLAWHTAGHVAWGIIVRAIRKPQELVHLVAIVFFVGPVAGTLLQDGALNVPVLAGAGVVLGTYLSGATFGLNPLGDDRPQFPLLLLTAARPRTYVHGRIVAGLAVGVPVAVGVPLVAAALGGTPTVAAFAGFGLLSCLGAGLLAPGVGCLYPIYEERAVWGTETVSPSMLVVMGFMFATIIVTALGLVALWTLLGGGHLSVVVLVALGVFLLIVVGLPLVAYRYAVRRYRRYTVD
ncbi:hypothetical protein SAMN04487949_2821 [Halogranum gelatinilyticum]|uniref:ABC-2 type transport system permease protein n=1 Tax=Halogranum gelatinilyticum TaxID=660521 RepID=A0A1G9X3Q5_9EURY|nr:hypothetical protein [Halogranum gelatinilyticum]SDM91171.1 hypothetical protein SAMN04487949_2821 [Halogranum gelatinilyticum]